MKRTFNFASLDEAKQEIYHLLERKSTILMKFIQLTEEEQLEVVDINNEIDDIVQYCKERKWHD